jgi:uncharacterized protein
MFAVSIELIAFVLLLIAGLIGLVAIFFTTFGTFIIILGSFVYSLLTGFNILGIKPFILLLILYLFGEMLEYVLLIVGTKRVGGSNAAVVGALLGGIAGAILGTAVLGVGIIIGTFLGIFVGAFSGELLLGRGVVKSLKAGAGSVVGRGASIAAKVFIALIMFAIIGYNIGNHYIL